MPENNTQQSTSSASNTLTVSSGKIAIGFGLSGYQTKTSDASSSSAMGAGGYATASWSDAETVGDRYIKDDTLKQILVQITCFQSAPLRWQHPTDGTTYINCYDNVDSFSDSINGFSNRIIGCTMDPQLEKAKEAESKLNGKDFDSGYAICWQTLSAYLNHFYNLNVGREKIYGSNGLLGSGLVKAELFINTGGGEGRAIRLCPVDSAGNSGYKGSSCFPGPHIAKYDKFDINVSLTLTKAFEGVVKTYSSKHKCPINTGQLDFPWKDSEYDWRTGKIIGYNPKEMLSWKGKNKFGKANDTPADCDIIFTSKVNTNEFRNGRDVSKPLARVRFFTDNLEAARQIVPGLPDEFAKTNYTEGATAAFNANDDASNYSTIGGLIVNKAQELKAFMATENSKSSSSVFYYNMVSNSASPCNIPNWRFNYYPNKDFSNRRAVCCGSFVSWVLGISGICKDGVVTLPTSVSTTPNSIKNLLKPEYDVRDIGSNISQAMRGDVLVFAGGGAHHLAIFDRFENGRIYEWGAGGNSSINSPNATPSSSKNQSNLKYIIRIVNANQSIA